MAIITTAGITLAQIFAPAVDLPPTIVSTPAPPSFTEGIVGTYNMEQHVSDDGVSTVTFSLTNVLPNGLSINSSTGILTYDGIGIPSVSQHQLIATDAVGSDTSAAFNITIQAVNPRNILAEFAQFDAGGIKSSVSADPDGIFRDFGFIFGADKWGSPITITNVTKANPAIATFTGTIQTHSSGRLAGYTFDDITSGMTELSGRLFRPKNVSGSTFEMFQDGDDNGLTVPQEDIEGTTPTNSNGYSSWSGSVQAQAYKKVINSEKNLWRAIGSDEYPFSRVVEGSFTPPDNINGSADPVTALEGNRFYAQNIVYWIDHTRRIERDNMRWQARNTPREALIWSNSKVQMDENETMWVGFSILLPSNFDNTTITRNDDLSEDQVFEIQDDIDIKNNPDRTSNFNVVQLNIARNSSDPSGIMSWVLDYAGDGAWITGSPDEENKLEEVVDDIGLWTSFVVKIIMDEFNGTLKIWKSTGPYFPGTQERAMRLVFDRTSGGVGFITSIGVIECGMERHKHAWHHHTGTGSPIGNYWIGRDSIRWGTEETEGTGYSDVHPFRQLEP